MRLIIFITLLFLTSDLIGQNNTEFEGIIKYRHRYVFNSTDLDTMGVIGALGDSSTFYYKNGNYKWIVYSGNHSKTEYFDSITQTIYYLFEGNDTLFMSKKNGFNDSLLTFESADRSEIVCGLECKKLITVSQNKDDPEMITQRTLYYNDAVSIGENSFSSYRTYATNKVMARIRCWPVKIELQSKRMPFIYILEGIKIISQKLADSEVYLPVAKPIKSLPLFQ